MSTGFLFHSFSPYSLFFHFCISVEFAILIRCPTIQIAGISAEKHHASYHRCSLIQGHPPVLSRRPVAFTAENDQPLFSPLLHMQSVTQTNINEIGSKHIKLRRLQLHFHFVTSYFVYLKIPAHPRMVSILTAKRGDRRTVVGRDVAFIRECTLGMWSWCESSLKHSLTFFFYFLYMAMS